MAHNPPRPKSLDDAAMKEIAESVARPPERKWETRSELAHQIEQRAAAGKRVVLTPETAMVVVEALRWKP